MWENINWKFHFSALDASKHVLTPIYQFYSAVLIIFLSMITQDIDSDSILLSDQWKKILFLLLNNLHFGYILFINEKLAKKSFVLRDIQL